MYMYLNKCLWEDSRNFHQQIQQNCHFSRILSCSNTVSSWWVFLTEECVECVRINFRWIRDQLHFEMTADHLVQNAVISCAKTPENTIHRGFLVKSAIRKGHRGCESLLRCLETQQKETFEKALKVWTDRKKFGKY